MEIVGGSLLLTQHPLDEVLARLKSMGFRWIELGVQDWCDLRPDDLVCHFERELERTRVALDRHGLEPVAINASAGSKPNGRMEAMLRFAQALAVRHVTIQSLPADQPLAADVERLKPLVVLGAAQGIQISVETHLKCITEQPQDALRLARAVPGLGLTLDLSHYYANGTEAEAVTLLPYVKHVHIRDCGRNQIQMPFGQGLLNLSFWCARFAEAGYPGMIAIEYIDQFADFDVVESMRLCRAGIQEAWGDRGQIAQEQGRKQ